MKRDTRQSEHDVKGSIYTYRNKKRTLNKTLKKKR